MCVMFVSFVYKVKPFGCVAMCSAVLFILRSIWLVYLSWSEVNRVQVFSSSGFSVRLFCFVQAKTVCRHGCIYFFAALVLVCVYVMVMSSALTMTRTGGLGGGKSAV